MILENTLKSEFLCNCCTSSSPSVLIIILRINYSAPRWAPFVMLFCSSGDSKYNLSATHLPKGILDYM